MIISVNPMGSEELDRLRDQPGSGFGALHTDRGNLPLDRLDVQARISGLLVRTELTTEFVNTHDTALEATYVFPLPDRAAVTAMSMTAADRTVVAQLRERAEARAEYDRAMAAGQRATIAEEERPDVFTMRVGNIPPGERVSVRLRLVGPLPYEDGAATFRFPLVVAPRYVPGTPLPGPYVGDGQHPDTDAVPDASRISPPVLLPGFPNPLKLSIGVEVDPAGLHLGEVRSSLHTVTDDGGTLRIATGERADRDFVLRLAYAAGGETAVAVPDEEGDQGTYQLVVLPPETATARRPKDVVLLLDRSGSMSGWKMVAARRAAARVVDTLTSADRFTVLTFDHQVERPDGLAEGLVEASDRNRYRAVEHLARADARGGTELLTPLRTGLALLSDSTGRDRVLVLVTDGQVGNEDQIVRDVSGLIGSTRVHTVGIDRAVNAGFLGRLAMLGAGRAELVESEDRLDEAMDHIHRRIGAPVVTALSVSGDGITLLPDTRSPGRLPGLYPGVPLVVTGRYTGVPGGNLSVAGRTRDEQEYRTTVTVQQRSERAVASLWARARIRDLEDAYAAGNRALEQEIVSTSLRFGVLCRFTAYVAVDERVVNEGGKSKRVTQPVELPSGWEPPAVGGSLRQFGTAVGVAFSAPAAPMPPGGPAPGGPMPFKPPFAPVRARGADVTGMRGDATGMRGGATKRGPRPTPPAPRRVLADAADAPEFLTADSVAPESAISSAPIYEETFSDDDAEFGALIVVETNRLRDAAGLPAADRRDLLDDLATRLAMLLETLPGHFEPLRALVDLLRGDASLDEKWAQSLRILTGLSASHQAPSPGDEGIEHDESNERDQGDEEVGRAESDRRNKGSREDNDRGESGSTADAVSRGGPSQTSTSGNTGGTGAGESLADRVGEAPPASREEGRKAPFWKR